MIHMGVNSMVYITNRTLYLGTLGKAKLLSSLSVENYARFLIQFIQHYVMPIHIHKNTHCRP